MHLLAADSPFRPPDWRWKRSIELLDANLGVRRGRDDKEVGFCKTFCRQVRRMVEPYERERLYASNPPRYHAYHIYTAGGKVRQELEARLLTGKGLNRIGAKMGLSTEAVQWYESFFFNVYDRLQNVSWVSHHVIGPQLFDGLTHRDQGLIWKVVAYGGGDLAFDAIFQIFNGPKPENTDEVDPFFNRQANALLRHKALHNLMTLHATDSFAKMQLAQLHLEFMRLEREFSAGAEIETLTRHLEKALISVPFGVGDKGYGADDLPAGLLGGANEKDKGAVEMRAYARIDAVAGVTQEALPAPVFPEPQREQVRS